MTTPNKLSNKLIEMRVSQYAAHTVTGRLARQLLDIVHENERLKKELENRSKSFGQAVADFAHQSKDSV